MLTCQGMTEAVTDYIEDRMSLWRKLQFQLHLGMCHNCRAYLRQVKLTLQTLGELPAEPMPDDVREELLRRFSNPPSDD